MERQQVTWRMLCRKLQELNNLHQLTLLLYNISYPYTALPRWEEQMLLQALPLVADISKASFLVKLLDGNTGYNSLWDTLGNRPLPFQIQWITRTWVPITLPWAVYRPFPCYWDFLQHQWTVQEFS